MAFGLLAVVGVPLVSVALTAAAMTATALIVAVAAAVLLAMTAGVLWPVCGLSGASAGRWNGHPDQLLDVPQEWQFVM